MKINHHITFKVDEDRKAIFEKIGIDTEKASKMFSWSTMEDLTFDILEDNPRWPHVRPLIKEWKGLDVTSTSFSVSELKKTEYMRTKSTWYCHTDHDYLHSFYDKSNSCPNCGIGKQQAAPFRMRMEPKWGTRHCIQFYGYYDLLFVRPEVWHDVFKPFGVGCLPVYKKNSDEKLKTVVQLNIDRISNSPLNTEKLNYVVCPYCCQTKYDFIRRGPIPDFLETPNCHMFKTQENFCISPQAMKMLIISQELYQAITKHKLKSLKFTPLSQEVLDNCHGRNN